MFKWEITLQGDTSNSSSPSAANQKADPRLSSNTVRLGYTRSPIIEDWYFSNFSLGIFISRKFHFLKYFIIFT